MVWPKLWPRRHAAAPPGRPGSASALIASSDESDDLALGTSGTGAAANAVSHLSMLDDDAASGGKARPRPAASSVAMMHVETTDDAASTPAGSTTGGEDGAAADAVPRTPGRRQVDQDARSEAAAAAKVPAPGPKGGSIGVPIGRRVFTDEGIDLESRQNPLVEAFALATMAAYCGMIHVLLGLAVASIFSRAFLLLLVGLLSLQLIPARPLLWDAFLRNPVWTAWRRYFRFSVCMDADVELDDTKYVIAEYPHGVFPLSQLIAVSLVDVWPGHRIYSIAADVVFSIPVWRHVMTWIGALPATAENFRLLLQKGSVGLVPGGIAEMFMVEEDREVIKLLDRKGFVRIAVEAGAPLVPVYHFGCSRLFKWGPKSWEKAARRHRVALGLLFGRWGLPLALPNRVPLMMAVGAPVPVRQTPRDDPGFAAAVDEAHAALVEAMAALYDKYKGAYGWEDRPLAIK